MKKYLVGIALYSILCASLIVTPISEAQTVAAPTLGSSTLVLSQVSGGNGTYTHDYVEIKNVSGSNQSLNGLSLYYGSATGNFGAGTFALPNASIAPGQYYLVQLTQSGTGGAALPVTPDATAAAGAISMSGSSGKIGLVIASQLAAGVCGATATPCNSAQLAAFVDWVAYGTGGNGPANTGEGGNPAVNNNVGLTSTQAAVRKTAGCTDTDNNNADFDVVTSPVPRNTATTPAPCSNTTNPSGVGASNPNAVFPGATTLLTVTVTPGANPASTGLTVTADLSSIGGSATQSFFDNGTNGDQTAGDNIYSFSATVGAQVSQGVKSLPFTITDTQARSGSGNIALTVNGTTPTNPTGVGAANPSSVAVGDLTLLTVTVTPGTNPASTGITVNADLSSIGGSANQQFFDDGVNGGDLTANDNIYSFFYSIPLGTSQGQKTLPATIADAQARTGTTSISVTVASSAGLAEHLAFGNPSAAVSDPNQPNNYLLVKSQYVMSYNCSKGIPNWVAWHLDSTWIGSSGRNDSFRPDPALSAIPNCYQVQDTDYSGGGFDRGHHCPSGDRTRSVTDNQATFFMTNMMPQASNNNQGVWADLENYARSLAQAGNELYIYAGGAGQGGVGTNGFTNTIAGGKVVVPAITWKVIVVIPNGSNDADRVTKTTRTIAVMMDNRNDTMPSPGQGNWRNYRVSIKKVEALTGYNFLTGLRPIVRNTLKYRVDTQ